MALHFMPGVRFDLFTGQSMLALEVANECFAEQDADCIITSAYREGDWSRVMLHGQGHAFDLSVKKLNGEPLQQGTVDKIVANIKSRIGKETGGQYDVLYEGDKSASVGWTGKHIHIEYDPANGASRPKLQVT